MISLRVDGSSESILIKFKAYCQQRGIVIKYTILYLYKENSLIERGWKILIIMKDSLLIDSGLYNTFWAETIETANYL